MKLVFFILPILIFIVVVFNRCTNFQTQNVKKASPKESFYDLSARTINGNNISMSDYKNKKILIVNVASQCGYTPQYKDLQNLHANFGDKLHILAFPSNDFLGQEPGSNEQIKNFCEVNFGIKFDMFEKISVKGKKIHPIFKWLSDKNKNGWNTKTPTWNFSKYLIDESGSLISVWGPQISPLSEDIISKIND